MSTEELRLEAIKLAAADVVRHGESADDVVKRAEVYFVFLQAGASPRALEPKP